jgi:hypothetical protein
MGEADQRQPKIASGRVQSASAPPVAIVAVFTTKYAQNESAFEELETAAGTFLEVEKRASRVGLRKNKATNMPHTTTKNQRSKRIDTRPNAKFRQKEFKKYDKLNKIEDLRVTRVNSKNRKERVAVTLAKQLSDDEKRLRALRKKLNSIVELQEKEENGTVLDAQQQEKLKAMERVVAEISALAAKLKKKDRAQLPAKKKAARQTDEEDDEESGDDEEMDEDEEEDEEEDDA